MKKIFYLASIAALAFSSCAKDETTEAQINAVNGGSKITAAIAADDTRTSLELVDGDYKVRWSAGDQLGVYGVGANTLNNAAFVLDNASDGQAVGVFASQSTELKADKAYIAVYPRFQEGLFAGVGEVKYPNPAGATTPKDTDVVKSAAYERVVAKIPATQKYQNGSFYTQTVPSVSTNFTVDAKGGAAEVSMQPVVDYLMVNLTSTEPIYTLQLELTDADFGRFQLAGQNNLKKYVHNGEYRYYLDFANEDGTLTTYSKGEEGTVITLELDETYAAVNCHKPNTYVFTVPANILGHNTDVHAILTVNGGEPEKAKRYILTSDEDKIGKTIKGADYFTNWTMNYKQKDATKGHGDANRVARGANALTARTDDQVLPLENTIFWMNPISVDTDGDKKADARGSFVYNPYGDVIIQNEVELLRYIVQYNLQQAAANNSQDQVAPTSFEDIDIEEEDQYYGKDAFLCEDGSFDFSIKNMMELATEYENTEFEPYIAAYLADVQKGGGFPCFEEYENNFIGNGAVIENIEQPLLNPAGIFGGPWFGMLDPKNYEYSDITVTRAGENVETENGKASITDITFANVVAATVEGSEENEEIVTLYPGSYTADIEFSGRGYILAGYFDGTIKNVTVKNADGEAVMGVMPVAQFNALKFDGVSKLANIADILVANADLDMTKTWDNVAGVEESVFQYILPSKNAKGEDALHVITIAKGDADTYAELTDEVLADGLFDAIKLLELKLIVKESDEDPFADSAVAVVIENVSYWTGDTFAVWQNDDKNCVNKNATPKVYYVRYAEELAGGNGEDVKLARNIDLNYLNLVVPEFVDPILGPYPTDTTWEMVPFASLDGGNFSVSNVMMSALGYDYEDKAYTMEPAIAPFDAPVVKNITLNNVYIDVATPAKEVELYVPRYIAGLTLGGNDVKTVIENATVNNLVIDTERDDNTNNTEANYSDEYETRIGWLVATAADAQITNAKVNGVESTVKGIAGLVAENVITVSSKFDKVSVENVDAVNTPLKNFTDYNFNKVNYNTMGTAVGIVYNAAGRKADIKFMQCGEPVFLYYAPDALTVIYNETEKGSFTSM